MIQQKYRIFESFKIGVANLLVRKLVLVWSFILFWKKNLLLNIKLFTNSKQNFHFWEDQLIVRWFKGANCMQCWNNKEEKLINNEQLLNKLRNYLQSLDASVFNLFDNFAIRWDFDRSATSFIWSIHSSKCWLM